MKTKLMYAIKEKSSECLYCIDIDITVIDKEYCNADYSLIVNKDLAGGLSPIYLAEDIEDAKATLIGGANTIARPFSYLSENNNEFEIVEVEMSFSVVDK